VCGPARGPDPTEMHSEQNVSQLFRDVSQALAT